MAWHLQGLTVLVVYRRVVHIEVEDGVFLDYHSVGHLGDLLRATCQGIPLLLLLFERIDLFEARYTLSYELGMLTVLLTAQR